MNTSEAIKILEAGKEFLKMQPFSKYAKAIELVLDNLEHTKCSLRSVSNELIECKRLEAKLRADLQTLKDMHYQKSEVIIDIKQRYENVPNSNSNVELACRFGALGAIDAIVDELVDIEELAIGERRLHCCTYEGFAMKDIKRRREEQND